MIKRKTGSIYVPYKIASLDDSYWGYNSLADALENMKEVGKPGRQFIVEEDGVQQLYIYQGETIAPIKVGANTPVFTSTTNGLVPAPNETTSTKFLRGDGQWVVPVDTTRLNDSNHMNYYFTVSVDTASPLPFQDYDGTNLEAYDSNKKYPAFEVSMNVTATGTTTGTKYILYINSNTWEVIKIGNASETISNHPVLFVDTDGVPKIKIASHTTKYPVACFVKRLNVSNNIFNVRRLFGLTFDSLLDKPTTLSGYGIRDAGITGVVTNTATSTTNVASTFNGSTFINRMQGGVIKESVKFVGAGDVSITHSTGGIITVKGTDTTYSAGNGLTLSGTAFSLPITVSGSGNAVSEVTQTTNGITVVKTDLDSRYIQSNKRVKIINLQTSGYATKGILRIDLGPTFVGRLNIQITGSFGAQNVNGLIEIDGGVGTNSTSIWNNQLKCTKSIGAIRSSFYIDPIIKTDENNIKYFEIHKKQTANNEIHIKIEAFTVPASLYDALTPKINSFTVTDDVSSLTNEVEMFGSLLVNDDTTSKGFIKKDSSDSYILLGGGGHKLLSDFTDTAGTNYFNKTFPASGTYVNYVILLFEYLENTNSGNKGWINAEFSFRRYNGLSHMTDYVKVVGGDMHSGSPSILFESSSEALTLVTVTYNSKKYVAIKWVGTAEHTIIRGRGWVLDPSTVIKVNYKNQFSGDILNTEINSSLASYTNNAKRVYKSYPIELPGVYLGSVNFTSNDGKFIDHLSNTRIRLATGETVISGNNANIYLRPNGDAATSNQITIGVNGSVTGTSFIKSGGTSAQFLKADGSVDSTAYTTDARISNFPNATNWTNASHRFSGLPNKSSDATYNQFALFDANGNLGRADKIYNAFYAGLQGITSEQALKIGHLLNGGAGSAGAISVNLISPPIIQNRFDSVEYVLLRGANLFLDSESMKIEILAEDKTTVVATIPNANIQLYSDGTQLVFYYNFYQFLEGRFFLRITSGAKIYITTLDLRVVSEIEDINLNTIEWENVVNSDVVLNTSDNYNGRSFVLNTPAYSNYGDVNSYSFKSNELFAEGEDFYIEMELTINQGAQDANAFNHDTRVGIGYSNIENSLVPIPMVYLSVRKGNFNRTQIGLNNSNYDEQVTVPVTVNFTIIKTGNLFRLIQGNKQHVITLSNNSGYSFFFQTAKKRVSNVYTLQFIKAFKFN